MQIIVSPRRAIFEKEGTDVSELTPEQVEEVFEDILLVLDKFLFKWSEGQTNDTSTSVLQQQISMANNMKKGSANAMKMLKMQTGEGELEAFRTRLSKISEDLLFLLTQVESLADKSWGTKKSDVNSGLSTLNGFLSKLRLKLSQKLPVDKTSDQ
ncbi:unnamed protein product [Symbiodinium sp. CCMP2592]|nr:unnamed protein product [Symbiodinium sp. CCMP2592]